MQMVNFEEIYSFWKLLLTKSRTRNHYTDPVLEEKNCQAQAAFAPFFQRVYGTISAQHRNGLSPAPRTKLGLLVKPDFLAISIRSLCAESPFEVMHRIWSLPMNSVLLTS